MFPGASSPRAVAAHEALLLSHRLSYDINEDQSLAAVAR